MNQIIFDIMPTDAVPMGKGMIIHPDMTQGSDEWAAARCGLLTASEMRHIITPAKLQYASNDKERAHLYELVAQRITSFVEPSYISDDMLRGMNDEHEAKLYYAKSRLANMSDLQTAGFITNDKWGFTIGYSPDGLVGSDGLVECKSRRQKYQIETIIGGVMITDYVIQVQTGLLVSERKWCDFISFCGGMPMFILRVYPDEKIQAAIIEAAATFYGKMEVMLAKYHGWVSDQGARLIPTERKIEEQMI